MADKLQIIPVGLVQPEEKPRGVWTRRLAFTDKVMLFETRLEAGRERPPHTHPNDQVGMVMQGEIEVVWGGQSYACREGDSYAVPGGQPHAIRAVTDALIVDAFDR
jgi:quercetin dioxygenase-like cupin family protein